MAQSAPVKYVPYDLPDLRDKRHWHCRGFHGASIGPRDQIPSDSPQGFEQRAERKV